MSSMDDYQPLHGDDHAPGDEPVGRHEIAEGVVGYLVGLGLAILLTAVSFFIAGTFLVWRPSIPIALVVLAIAQIGVHFLIMVGSLWIMYNMNQNMMPMHMPMG
jgi:cytochrome o ubiquinol oxidase subunit IV